MKFRVLQIFFLAGACCFLLAGKSGAHSSQDAPAFVRILPQRTFLTVVISGNGGDLADQIHADSHGLSPSQASVLSSQSRAEASKYFAHHLMLKQGGARLDGQLRALRLWQSDALDSSRTRFEAVLYFPRAPDLTDKPLRVTSALFSDLEKSRTVVVLGGQEKALDPNQTAEFAAASTSPDVAQNAGAWIVKGISHIVFGWEHLLFVVALFLAASHLPLRAVAWALGAFTLSHGATFCLATTGVLAPSPQLVGVGVAASILAMGGHDFLLSRAAQKPQNTASIVKEFWRNASTRLAILAFACGLVHGFVFAPSLIEIGLPEEGLAICLVAFLIGTALTQAALGVVTWRVLVTLRARFEHGKQYGGMNWPRATQMASLAVAVVGGYWMIERLLG